MSEVSLLIVSAIRNTIRELEMALHKLHHACINPALYNQLIAFLLRLDALAFLNQFFDCVRNALNHCLTEDRFVLQNQALVSSRSELIKEI